MTQSLTSGIHRVPAGVILVVDDDPMILDLVLHLLELAGHNAIACATPTAVLDELTKTQVNVLVSDILMPEMSGLTLAGLVHEQHPELPVVLMTGGQAHRDLAPVAAHAGAFAILQKPFEASQLWSTIDRALAHRLRTIQKRAG